LFFKNKSECEQWARLLQIGEQKIQKNAPFIESDKGIQVAIENDRYRSLAIAKGVVSWLGDFGSCLFWVHEYGIWPSSENWQLYYALRTSYGDRRQLGEAPGHFLLEYEKADLVTLIDIAIRFGWGAHILPAPKWTYVYLSHDGWIHVETEIGQEKVLKDIGELSLNHE
jgi:hypothetical protein